jgi:hypothetical protein
MTSQASDELLADVSMGRIAVSQEIARAVVWLTSPEASYVTGTVLTRCQWLPGVLHRALGSRPLIAGPGRLLGELKYRVDQPAGAALGAQPGRQIQR